MKLSLKFLQRKQACSSGLKWYNEHGQPDTVEACVAALIADANEPKNLNYASWLLSQTLSEPDCRRYAIFAARQVIGIYEKQYPEDARPRKSIEAAEAYLEGKISREELAAAMAAAGAAEAAAGAWDARVAGDAAWAARDAADREMLLKIVNYGATLISKGDL